MHLDYGASITTSTVGTLQSNITPGKLLRVMQIIMLTSALVLPLLPPGAIMMHADIEPTFIGSVQPRLQELSEESPEASLMSVAGSSLSGGHGSGWGQREASGPSDSGRGGREQEEEIHSSLSPHRTLSQTEPLGTGQADFLESRSGSYSPRSSLAPHGEILRLMDQHGVKGAKGTEEEEEELVMRKPKSKSGKKKKKKKKPKISAESAKHAEQEKPGAESAKHAKKPGAMTTQNSADVAPLASVQTDSAEVASSQNVTGFGGAPASPPHVAKGREPSPSDHELPWGQWTAADLGVATSEGDREETLQGEYLEECDLESSLKLHPLPLKKLSLADELEMAMDAVSPSPDDRPHPSLPPKVENPPNHDSIATVPSSDPTLSDTSATPPHDHTPTDNLPEQLLGDDRIGESSQADTPPSGNHGVKGRGQNLTCTLNMVQMHLGHF